MESKVYAFIKEGNTTYWCGYDPDVISEDLAIGFIRQYIGDMRKPGGLRIDLSDLTNSPEPAA